MRISHLALSLAAVFLLGVPAWAQPTVVASTMAQCPVQSSAITTGTNCGGSTVPGSAINTSGSSLLACEAIAFVGTSGTGTLSDSKGNTWNALTLYTAGSLQIKLWYAIPASSAQIGTGHTFTLSGVNQTFTSIGCAAFVGTQATTAFRSGSDVGGASTLSITPIATNDLLFTGISDNSSASKTITSPFAVLGTPITNTAGETGAIAWMAAPNTSTVTFTWSNGGTFAQSAAAFEVGPAPLGASEQPRRH